MKIDCLILFPDEMLKENFETHVLLLLNYPLNIMTLMVLFFETINHNFYEFLDRIKLIKFFFIIFWFFDLTKPSNSYF